MSGYVSETEFNTVSQISHTLGGLTAVFATIVLLSPKALWVICPIYIVFFSVKEFWYDPVYQTAAESGSSGEDLGIYLAGLFGGLLLWGLRLLLDRHWWRTQHRRYSLVV